MVINKLDISTLTIVFGISLHGSLSIIKTDKSICHVSDKDVTSENPWMCCYEVVFKLGNIQFEGLLPSSVHLPSLKSFKWILLTKSGSTAAIIYLSYYFLHCTSQISSFLRACTKNHSCNTVHHESFKRWVFKWCTFFTWSFK